jgi:surface antigen
MSVLERHKQRSAYKKSNYMSLSSNIYQSSTVAQSSLLDSSAQSEEVTPVPVQSSLLDSSAQSEEATPVPQLSFTNDLISSTSVEDVETAAVPAVSTALIARDIPDEQFALPAQTDAKPLRVPTRIPSTGKKSSGMILAPRVTGKRPVTHAIVLALTFFIILGVLAAVLPLQSDGQALGGHSLIDSLMRWSQAKNGNTALINSQRATATAVMQDGYDAGGGVTYPGIPGAPSGSPNLNRFFYGQCTYFANMEYGRLTGFYVPWLGNANQWVYGARAYGWNVSTIPTVPSIIALDPYVDGAGAYGHVGVVTAVNGNQVTYGSWNYAGAPFATTTYVTITAPASGVWFLTHP